MGRSTRHRCVESLRSIGILFEPGDIIEVRAVNVGRTTDRAGVTKSGYFNFENSEALAKAVEQLDGQAEGIYVVLNRLNPALLARANNHLQTKPKHVTSDADIIDWRWLYIDADPARPAGISSTDAEHVAALDRASKVRDALAARGWPEPVYTDSGNGAHLLYRLPKLELARAGDLVKRCLKALAIRFSDDVVNIDESTSNPARICKLYGTLTRKGDSLPDRPHRRARIIAEPVRVQTVPIAALESLAAEAVAEHRQTADKRAWDDRRTDTKTRNQKGSFDLQEWIDAHYLDVEGPKPWSGGNRWIFRVCPWNSEHRNRSAYIVHLANGAISAGCHHSGCQAKDWQALRDLVEPGWRKQYQSPTPDNSGPSRDWEPPIPFDQFNLPTFPTVAFPDWLRSFVEAEARATQPSLRKERIWEEFVVLGGLDHIDDPYLLEMLLYKRLAAAHPSATPDELERHKERCLTEINLRRLRAEGEKLQTEQGRMARQTNEPMADPDAVRTDINVELLNRIVDKKHITIEAWAADHKLGRSTVFAWKAGRSAGTPLKGKVSKARAEKIERHIREDAEELGLRTRTGSD